jgi:hypothetical protein
MKAVNDSDAWQRGAGRSVPSKAAGTQVSSWIYRNVFALRVVLAGRKPLVVAGRRIQRVHGLISI